jgi:tryptophan synthase alpha subunit
MFKRIGPYFLASLVGLVFIVSKMTTLHDWNKKGLSSIIFSSTMGVTGARNTYLKLTSHF